MKIILDAMGGDHAPEAPVMGAVQAAMDFGAQITLVGRGEEILEVMRKRGIQDLPAGMEIAQRIYARHKALTEILIRIGVDPVTAQEDACRVEHDISGQTDDAIVRQLGKL